MLRPSDVLFDGVFFLATFSFLLVSRQSLSFATFKNQLNISLHRILSMIAHQSYVNAKFNPPFVLYSIVIWYNIFIQRTTHFHKCRDQFIRHMSRWLRSKRTLLLRSGNHLTSYNQSEFELLYCQKLVLFLCRYVIPLTIRYTDRSM